MVLHGFLSKTTNIFQSNKVESHFSNEKHLSLKYDNQAQLLSLCQKFALSNIGMSKSMDN